MISRLVILILAVCLEGISGFCPTYCLPSAPAETIAIRLKPFQQHSTRPFHRPVCRSTTLSLASDDNDDDDDEFETVNEDEMTYNEKYNNDGSLRRTNAQKAILRAGWPSGGMFAIVKMAGSQFKVVPDDVLIVNRLKPRNKWTVGSVHTLKDEDVLLLGTSHYTLVGLPFVAGAEVDVMVEEITKGEKVVIFKKRRRKHSQRKKGFRRDVTMLRILNVRPPESLSGENYRARIETEYKPLPDDFDLDEEEDGDYYDEEEDELEGEEDEKQSKAVA
mmetsp:Transcript_6610/g.18528  ORF Transcript_6610/g.18528 Transcript_6610/m.18528 type:complete len:276 (-) Transcript_6610:50-877(-)